MRLNYRGPTVEYPLSVRNSYGADNVRAPRPFAALQDLDGYE